MVRHHHVRWWLAGAALLLIGVAAYVAAEAAAVARPARRGRADLVAAESALRSRQLPAARHDLDAAEAEFRRAQRRLHSTASLLPAVRRLPLAKGQLKAVDALAGTGIDLAVAGRSVAAAVDSALHGPGGNGLGASLQALGPVDDALGQAVAELGLARRQVAALDRAVLIGPIASARRDATQRVDKAESDLVSLRVGLRAVGRFAGAGTPGRTYLILNQDSAEIRPTGGDIDSFAVLQFDASGARVSRFEDIGAWEAAHPQATLPNPPQPIATLAALGSTWEPSLANWSPDFPTSAEQFLAFWAKAGEVPVDGVVGVTPEVLVRVLQITGPLAVADYGRVDANNLLQLGYDSVAVNPAAPRLPGGRKSFLAEVTQSALNAAAALPRARLLDLGQTLAAGFRDREILVFDPDPAVAGPLAAHHWDGALRPAGDFTMDVEANMTASKNNRPAARHFDRSVTLRPDGSASVQLQIRLKINGPGSDNFTPNQHIYVRVMAPAGSSLTGGTAPGWFADVPEHGLTVFGNWAKVEVDRSVDLTLSYQEPGVAEVGDQGLSYRLVWQKQPGTGADTARNAVVLPAGYRWIHAPPRDLVLSGDIDGNWTARKR